MILSGFEIKKQVKTGSIIINPFDEKRINPNSYNYRLGNSYRELTSFKSNGEPQYSALSNIPEMGLKLLPRKLYLSTTEESIGSEEYVVSLIGRSSVGRLGLFVQISADLGNLGSAHQWTLELTCVQPIIIYAHMIIGQVSFWVPDGTIAAYSGIYHNFDTPQGSLRTLRSDE
jgi:dCTP deaminase